MDRKGHLFIGIVAFLAFQWLLGSAGAAARDPWPVGIICTLAGSVFPDAIEPAYSSRHRGIFHSRGTLMLASALFIALGLASAVSLPGGKIPLAYPASCFLLGYLSHLLADATTPAGLPR